jgi:hypothetical protein
MCDPESFMGRERGEARDARRLCLPGAGREVPSAVELAEDAGPSLADFELLADALVPADLLDGTGRRA